MPTDSLFFQAFVYLASALIVVPVAARLGLGSVLGYLVAGVVIGPSLLGLVGSEGQDVLHFAEFGVVMMLFLVGLELDPTRLWRMRGPIFGLGGLQVVVTAAFGAAGGLAFGLPWQQAVAAGLILAMSSTAIGIQTLTERGLLKTEAGRTSFAVLLFQDIAVIPILAVFPLLSTLSVEHHGEGHGGTLVGNLPAPVQGAVILGVITAIVFAGRYLAGPVLRLVANTGLREMFTAASLLLVITVTLLMTAVGLSPALGAFVAGVVLANSEYRHELESDIEPFKGLLLGLFFMAVGASIDLGLIATRPGLIVLLLTGVLALKGGVLYGLARVFGSQGDEATHFATALGQVGEFAFVLLSFATASGILPDEVARILVAVTALSMAASPLVVVAGDRIARRLASVARSERPFDTIDEENKVIVAGFGRFGQIATRFLRSHGIGVTVLDVDGDQVEALRKFGQKAFYGDASRLDLLRSAGAEHADVLVVAIDDHAKALQIVHTARKHFPDLAILARARGRTEAYEMWDSDVEGVYRETFDTSLRVGVDVLRMLGFHAHRVHRAAGLFRKADEAAVREMAAVRKDEGQLMKTARERIAEVERTLQADREQPRATDDHGWDSAPLPNRPDAK